MAGKYEKKVWVNEETPLNADNLNNIESGIAKNEETINNLINAINQLNLDIVRLDETKVNSIDPSVTPELRSATVVYAKRNGADCHLVASKTQVEADVVVQRISTGEIRVPNTPTEDSSAASKWYVDDQVLKVKSDLSYLYSIDYETALSFDTTEIVINTGTSNTNSMLGYAVLGQLILV